MHRILTALIVAVAAAVLLLPVASAGAGPSATTANEDLVQYLDKGRLKAKNPIKWAAGCTATCSFRSRTILKLKGGRVGPSVSTGQLNAFNAFELRLRLTKRARSLLKENIKSAKLVTKFTATDLITGAADTDRKTFKFKR